MEWQSERRYWMSSKNFYAEIRLFGKSEIPTAHISSIDEGRDLRVTATTVKELTLFIKKVGEKLESLNLEGEK